MARPSLCWVLQHCFSFQIKSLERNFEGVEQRGVWQSEDKKEALSRVFFWDDLEKDKELSLEEAE